MLRAHRARWLAALDSMTMGARDTEPADCKVHIRGEDTQLGPTVPRGFPTVLTDAVDSAGQQVAERPARTGGVARPASRIR